MPASYRRQLAKGRGSQQRPPGGKWPPPVALRPTRCFSALPFSPIPRPVLVNTESVQPQPDSTPLQGRVRLVPKLQKKGRDMPFQPFGAACRLHRPDAVNTAHNRGYKSLSPRFYRPRARPSPHPMSAWYWNETGLCQWVNQEGLRQHLEAAPARLPLGRGCLRLRAVAECQASEPGGPLKIFCR